MTLSACREFLVSCHRVTSRGSACCRAVSRENTPSRTAFTTNSARQITSMVLTSKDNANSLSWLNSELLQTLLRLKHHDEHLQVVRYQVDPATSKGDNYLSDLYRVNVESRSEFGDERNTSLILKCKPKGGFREGFINTGKFFIKELEMFSKTLPEMYTHFKNLKSGTKLTPDYMHYVTESDVLIMEDLSKSDFRLAKRNGLDLAHCKMVMKYLGIFHALSVAVSEQKPQMVDLYRENVFNEETRGYMGSFLMSTIRSVALEVEKWPVYNEKYTEKLRNAADNSWEMITESTTRDEESFNVLNHGDLWVNNTMFHYAESGEVEDLRFIDFQMCTFTSPAIDLHYFLFSSPEPEVRALHYDSLLKEYHNSLCEALSQLGYSKKVPTLEQLQQDLKKRMFYALFASTSCLPNILADPEEGFDLESSLESGENPSSSNSKMYRSKSFKKEIQRLLPIFCENGIL